MGVRVYEEGHKKAGKASCDRKYVTAGKKVEVEWNSAEGNTDISGLRSLLGREIKITVPVDTNDTKKNGWIVKLYPHCAKAVYTVGPKDGEKHELYTCISTAELVEKGLISFAKGKPEVVG